MTWLQRILARLGWPPSPAPIKPAPTSVKFSSQLFTIADFDEADLIRRHNAERSKLGLHPLEPDGDLSDMAASRAAAAAKAGLAPGRLHDGFAGVPGAAKSGENAAMGQVDAVGVMADWMASPGHRADILDPAFGLAGAGRSVSEDGVTYWYVDFAG